MKLCSQCQFIYEDDQDCCDMDGAQLVYETTLQTGSLNPGAIGTITTPARRSIGLPIAAAVLLAVVVFASFYASSRAFENRPDRSATKLENPDSQPGRANEPPVTSSGVAAATEGAPQNNQNTQTANEPATVPAEPSPAPKQSPTHSASSPTSDKPSLNSAPNNSAPASPTIDQEEDQLVTATASRSSRSSQATRNLRSAHATISSRSVTDKRLTIPRLPQITTLPHVAALRRLPTAKPQTAKAVGSRQ